jgi:translation initiation factor 2 gamma subunit (eIF-2gamma)
MDISDKLKVHTFLACTMGFARMDLYTCPDCKKKACCKTDHVCHWTEKEQAAYHEKWSMEKQGCTCQ